MPPGKGGCGDPSSSGEAPGPTDGDPPCPSPASSFDNSHLCSCGADKTVALWDVATGQVLRKYRGHAGVRIRRGYGGELGAPGGN